jgi:hypothetical protein
LKLESYALYMRLAFGEGAYTDGDEDGGDE